MLKQKRVVQPLSMRKYLILIHLVGHASGKTVYTTAHKYIFLARLSESGRV